MRRVATKVDQIHNQRQLGRQVKEDGCLGLQSTTPSRPFSGQVVIVINVLCKHFLIFQSECWFPPSPCWRASSTQLSHSHSILKLSDFLVSMINSHLSHYHMISFNDFPLSHLSHYNTNTQYHNYGVH